MGVEIIWEVILIITGCVNIIGNIIVLLGLFLSGQRTPTHIYLNYVAVLSLLQQFFSPAFHSFYVSDFFVEFNLSKLLTLSFIFAIIGIITVLTLLLLIDYFEWIKVYKIAIIIVHFVLLTLIVISLHFIISSPRSESAVMLFAMLIACIFLLFFISQEHLQCLQKRKQTDDESTVRLKLVLAYVCSKILAGIVYAIDVLIYQLFVSRYYPVGILAFAFTQTDSIFFLVVLFSYDRNFKSSFFKLTRTFSLKKSDHVQFENQA